MREAETIGERTLLNNCVRQFILRFDLFPSGDFRFEEIINRIAARFDRTEKRIVNVIGFQLKDGKSEAAKTEEVDYVLISDVNNLSLTFSKTQIAFWLESKQYRDNSVYKELFIEIRNVYSLLLPETKTRRIGMRFINDFKCDSKREIKKILGAKTASIVLGMLGGDSLSRVIAQEEYNLADKKVRVQYGVPNKYYPSVISNFDLLLDIDSYVDQPVSVSDWTDTLSVLNHAAYELFVRSMNAEYLVRLK